MYQTPTLIPVGAAENVIRGTFGVGYDIDALFQDGAAEFECDDESEPAK